VVRKAFSKMYDYSEIEPKVESWNDFSSCHTKSILSNVSNKTDLWKRGSKSFDFANSVNTFGALKESVQDTTEQSTISPLNTANLKKLNRQKRCISFDTSLTRTFNTFGQSSIEVVNLNTNKRTNWKSKGNRSFDSSSSSLIPYGKTSAERAKESMELATQFSNKTFLQQVRIGSKIAMNDFRKSLQTNDK
jgi:hypothetical protein